MARATSASAARVADDARGRFTSAESAAVPPTADDAPAFRRLSEAPEWFFEDDNNCAVELTRDECEVIAIAQGTDNKLHGSMVEVACLVWIPCVFRLCLKAWGCPSRS